MPLPTLQSSKASVVARMEAFLTNPEVETWQSFHPRPLPFSGMVFACVYAFASLRDLAVHLTKQRGKRGDLNWRRKVFLSFASLADFRLLDHPEEIREGLEVSIFGCE